MLTSGGKTMGMTLCSSHGDYAGIVHKDSLGHGRPLLENSRYNRHLELGSTIGRDP
ncbi:hypothetical protein HOT24_gp46 [Klebsiella phage KP32_isolate 195]|uniref:Uncharacterized protein n=1 Tax=Klebsiella phage KP32_isolate 195 TaxID=2790306 RepID=A0A2U8USS4_9CAUD|nr:hypothetical protein HOT24_gp46 [Klebsiella phage KP32_isolate 195]AWN07177.1 hypothetical protein [Klebsiella phage KP32_isolate 195]